MTANIASPMNSAASTATTDKSQASTKLVTSKSTAVVKLLDRPRGATVAEIITATDWQPHSVRAYLSGLRKKGRTLIREPRKNGEQGYRLTSAALIAAPVSETTASVEA